MVIRWKCLKLTTRDPRKATKIRYMRSIFSMLVMLLVSVVLLAQQPTYVVSSLVNLDQELLEAALDNCSLDRYRKLDSRAVMNFDDGTKVQLLSFKELEALGLKIDASNAVPENTVNNNVFTLHPQGYILETIQPLPSLQNQKVRSEKQ